MAVQNYFTNYLGGVEDAAGVLEDWAIQGQGVRLSFFQKTIALAAADSAGSTYLILKGVSASAMFASLKLEADAMSGLTSGSIGIYDSRTGAAVAANALLNAADLHVGSTKLAPFDGMLALTHELTLQQMFLLAGDTLNANKGIYDLVFTANTAPVQAGSITFRGERIPSG